jgi:hypothetical protein
VLNAPMHRKTERPLTSGVPSGPLSGSRPTAGGVAIRSGPSSARSLHGSPPTALWLSPIPKTTPSEAPGTDGVILEAYQVAPSLRIFASPALDSSPPTAASGSNTK